MKISTIIILLVICIGSTAYSQQKKQSTDTIDVIALRHPEDFKSNNLFIKDNSLDKYVGTWVGKNGHDSFKLVLKKYNQTLGNISMDLLTGGYQQIRSGQEIYSLSDNILKASSGGKKDTLTFL